MNKAYKLLNAADIVNDS